MTINEARDREMRIVLADNLAYFLRYYTRRNPEKSNPIDGGILVDILSEAGYTVELHQLGIAGTKIEIWPKPTPPPTIPRSS